MVAFRSLGPDLPGRPARCRALPFAPIHRALSRCRPPLAFLKKGPARPTSLRSCSRWLASSGLAGRKARRAAGQGAKKETTGKPWHRASFPLCIILRRSGVSASRRLESIGNLAPARSPARRVLTRRSSESASGGSSSGPTGRASYTLRSLDGAPGQEPRGESGVGGQPFREKPLALRYPQGLCRTSTREGVIVPCAAVIPSETATTAQRMQRTGPSAAPLGNPQQGPVGRCPGALRPHHRRGLRHTRRGRFHPLDVASGDLRRRRHRTAMHKRQMWGHR